MRQPVRSILSLAVAALLCVPAVFRPTTAAALSCGPCPAVASEPVNLRDAPSLDSTVLGVIPADARLQWQPDVSPVSGYVSVVYDGVAGWAHDDHLLLYPASATTLTAVNQRQEPGLGAPVVGVLPDGASLILLDGPRSADGYDWYQVSFQGGDLGAAAGWVAGDFLDLDLR